MPAGRQFNLLLEIRNGIRASDGLWGDLKRVRLVLLMKTRVYAMFVAITSGLFVGLLVAVIAVAILATAAEAQFSLSDALPTARAFHETL